MSYEINGKIYTDHPLMDEIVYNCKKILNGLIVKNETKAIKSEIEDSVQSAELYKIQYEDGIISFSLYPFDEALLLEYGYTYEEIESYLIDKNNIPESNRESLTRFANEYFKNNFVEKNDYYRTLMGLPPYDSDEEYYIYLTDSDIPSSYNGNIDFTIPIHEQPNELITILYAAGVIDELRSNYKGSNYTYIEHLGDRSIDLYTARNASKWDILYMPSVYYLVRDRFEEIYSINREQYLVKVWQDFYAANSDYYEQEVIIMLIAQTFNDLIAEIPEWYIRRDIFDLRSCQYFLESNGVEYFSVIPLKYQIRIVKNLNRLIRYKSSNQSFKDIIDIFKIDANIVKYWLYKRQLKDDEGLYTNEYELEFITSKIDDSYDEYIRDPINHTYYDNITYEDKYWDSDSLHEVVKNSILDLDFTIEGTKYLSIEYIVDYKEYLYQLQYFVGLILDSNIDNSDIYITVPTIDQFSKFKLSDLFLFLIVLTNSYDRINLTDDSTKIRYFDYSKGDEPTEIIEDYYDWKKKYFPEIYVLETGRVNGFNPNVDKDKLQNILLRRHSHYQFGENETTKNGTILTDEEYKEKAIDLMDELGINDFIIPNHTIDTIEELISLYENNTKTYNLLRDKIYDAENDDDKKVLEFIYKELYTKEFDKNHYKLSDGTYATDLVELLKDKDYILWNYFNTVMNESDSESRKDMIRTAINDTIDTLSYYLKGEGFEYIFSFSTTESFFSIVNYIYLLINFFKSFEVSFLDPFITYRFNDKYENRMTAIDNIREKRISYNPKNDKAFSFDNFNINIERKLVDETNLSETMVEVADIFTIYEPDPNDDLDYNGEDATKDLDEYIDIDGGEPKDKNNYPYMMINAGKSYNGKIDLSDLDNSTAEEHDEYIDIDGGESNHIDDIRKDYFGSQGFTYDINAGTASNIKWSDKTINTKIVLGKDIRDDPDILQNDEDEITYNFGDIGLFDETAEGDYNFLDLDILPDGYEHYASGDYDFGEFGQRNRSDLIDNTDVNFGTIDTDESIQIDNLIYNFGSIDEEDESAEGDYDFGGTDEDQDDDTVIIDEADYDFNESVNDDDGFYNFDDIDDPDDNIAQANGDYDFGGTDNGPSQDSVVAEEADYDFNIISGDYVEPDEDEDQDDGTYNFGDDSEGNDDQGVVEDGDDYDFTDIDQGATDKIEKTKTILMNVKVSSIANNAVQITDDGLLIEDHYVNKTDFDNDVLDINADIDQLKSTDLYAVRDLIYMIKNPWYLDKRIDDCTNNYLYPILEVNDRLSANKFTKELNSKIDTIIEESIENISSEYGSNSFEWIELD